MLRGIDVSENNGYIDWQKVKNAGVQFAIIRIGYGKNHLDSCFYKNINGAIDVGLKVGVYHYSYALNKLQASDEANFVIHALKDCGLTPDKLALGIWLDMEDADGYKRSHGMPTNTEITAICSEFICYCNRNGYSCGIYANLNWLQNVINTKQLASYVPYWCAQWDSKCDWPNARLWQYTDSYYIDDYVFDGNLYFD